MPHHSPFIQSCASSFLDLILPPRCFGCANIVLEHHTLCSHCWKECTFLSSPCCALCGWPFSFETPEQTLCPHCHRLPPLFKQCRSTFAYQDGSRSLILKFKQGDGTYLAPGLSKLMLIAGQNILSHTDLLIPIPLHWKRLFMRQYNQAALLSYHLTHLTNIPTRTDLLKRQRSTQKQAHQNRKERQANVRGAFIIPDQKLSFLTGKSVTLIDDVFTTGATTIECTRILLKGGAKEVRILTLARVITPL